jgi:hypothetical protein
MLNPVVTKSRSGLAVCALSVLMIGCGDLLKVNDPGRFVSDDLDDPRAWQAVANGPEGRLQQAHSLFIIHSALLGGEYQSTGTWGQYRDIANATFVEGGESSQATQYFLSRLEAQEAARRFERLLGPEAATSALTGRVRAVEGWAQLMLGMLSCETVLEPNGPAVAPIEAFRAAIPILTNAHNILTAANATKHANFALAGRARANLYAGNLPAALADARAVPNGFVYDAIQSAQGASNNVVTLTTHTHNKAAGLRASLWTQIDTTGATDVFRDKFTNEVDRRVEVVHRFGNRRGVDGFSLHYSQFKYKTPFDNIRMTSKDEMRLIEAEVLMRQGDLAGAMAILNSLRAAANLSPVANPGTANGVRDVLLNERFAVLFLEGHRFHDLERFGLVREVLGANRATKFALPNAETTLNPNITAPRSCPARS